MERFLWICFAGALGTGARYLVGLWAASRLGATFPYGTLAVNLVGCFLVGLATHASLAITSVPATVRLAITTGFLGGFTTYSSFNYETTRLAEDGARGAALANVGVTVIGGFAAGLLGLALARRLFPA
ncbi:MAG TPA: fluoride efflux transporter CrcB [Nannocystaceae bacterium]|nr:fluoride efflux transporter CrcB [Nannocystaceae bacterium]